MLQLINFSNNKDIFVLAGIEVTEKEISVLLGEIMKEV